MTRLWQIARPNVQFKYHNTVWGIENNTGVGVVARSRKTGETANFCPSTLVEHPINEPDRALIQLLRILGGCHPGALGKLKDVITELSERGKGYFTLQQIKEAIEEILG